MEEEKGIANFYKVEVR